MKTYIIKNNRTGLFKIGRSRNPILRLKQIDQVKGDCELVLEIDHDCESLLHNCFYKCHISGEWFLLSNNDIIQINNYKNGLLSFTVPFYLLGVKFNIIKENKLIELKPLQKISRWGLYSTQYNYSALLNSDSMKEFINELTKKYGQIVSNNIGTKTTWVHILLFLEIVKNINPKLKIEIYEMLIGLKEPLVYDLIKEAVEEGKNEK